jgi:hypothetical protein
MMVYGFRGRRANGAYFSISVLFGSKEIELVAIW